MMAMKGLWIVLFVIIQISAVLCASTEKPSEKHLEGLARGLVIGETLKKVEKQAAVQDGSAVQLDATIPSKMSYGDYTYRDYYRYNTDVQITAFGIAAIIISVFTVLSFILGCILYYCCKKEPRRGYVVNYSGGQVSMMPQASMSQPGFVQPMQQSSMSQPGFVNPMHQTSPQEGQNQQQSIYPSVNATKQ